MTRVFSGWRYHNVLVLSHLLRPIEITVPLHAVHKYPEFSAPATAQSKLKKYVSGRSSACAGRIATDAPPPRPGAAACLSGPLRSRWPGLPHAILSLGSGDGLLH